MGIWAYGIWSYGHMSKRKGTLTRRSGEVGGFKIQFLTMTGGRDFSLSAPVAPELNYRKPRTNNLKAADLNVSAPVVPELKNAT